MKENYPNDNYINTDNDILKVDVNQIPTKKERKKKKKPTTKRSKKTIVVEPEVNYDITPITNENIIVKDYIEGGGIEEDNFAESNINIRNIIDSILFSQLSEIKVFLLQFYSYFLNNLNNHLMIILIFFVNFCYILL